LIYSAISTQSAMYG